MQPRKIISPWQAVMSNIIMEVWDITSACQVISLRAMVICSINYNV